MVHLAYQLHGSSLDELTRDLAPFSLHAAETYDFEIHYTTIQLTHG